MKRSPGVLSILALLLTIYSGNAITGDNGKSSLNILVYGASGKVGQHIVDEALGRGHAVTAVSRDPSRIVRNHENLVTARGDILDPDSVAGLVDGHDIIVVSVRGVVGDSGDPSETVVFRGVDNVVKALRKIGGGAPRLIHVGGAGSLEIEPGVLLADRLPKLFLPKKLEQEMAGQVLVLEYLRGVDDVLWTCITPPRTLTRGKRKGTYRIGGDQLMKDSHGDSTLTRADFAMAVIDEAESSAHVRRRISVAY
jgi:putative NADH-flavin reductase